MDGLEQALECKGDKARLLDGAPLAINYSELRLRELRSELCNSHLAARQKPAF